MLAKYSELLENVLQGDKLAIEEFMRQLVNISPEAKDFTLNKIKETMNSKASTDSAKSYACYISPFVQGLLGPKRKKYFVLALQLDNNNLFAKIELINILHPTKTQSRPHYKQLITLYEDVLDSDKFLSEAERGAAFMALAELYESGFSHEDKAKKETNEKVAPNYFKAQENFEKARDAFSRAAKCLVIDGRDPEDRIDARILKIKEITTANKNLIAIVEKLIENIEKGANDRKLSSFFFKKKVELLKTCKLWLENNQTICDKWSESQPQFPQFPQSIIPLLDVICSMHRNPLSRFFSSKSPTHSAFELQDLLRDNALNVSKFEKPWTEDEIKGIKTIQDINNLISPNSPQSKATFTL